MFLTTPCREQTTSFLKLELPVLASILQAAGKLRFKRIFDQVAETVRQTRSLYNNMWTIDNPYKKYPLLAYKIAKALPPYDDTRRGTLYELVRRPDLGLRSENISKEEIIHLLAIRYNIQRVWVSMVPLPVPIKDAKIDNDSSFNSTAPTVNLPPTGDPLDRLFQAEGLTREGNDSSVKDAQTAIKHIYHRGLIDPLSALVEWEEFPWSTVGCNTGDKDTWEMQCGDLREAIVRCLQ